MKVEIEINCDNSAFDGDNFTFEVKRILSEVSKADYLCGKPLFDINGNRVGKVRVLND